MNVFERLDKSMVTGYLQQAGSADPEAIRKRYLTLRSKMEFRRKLTWIPMGLGCLLIALGIVFLIVLIGVVLLIPGVLLAGGGWWARNRLRQNLVVTDAAYRDFCGVEAQPVSP